MHNLILIGAGDFGREVLAWALDAQSAGADWRVKGFLDDNPRALDGYDLGFEVLGDVESYQPAEGDVFVCSIGQPLLRAKVWEQMKAKAARFTRVIHPSAIVGPRVELGEGVILCPQVVLTCDLSIGDNSSLNVAVAVGHNVRIGRHCQISSFADITGHAVVGDGVFFGSRVSILPNQRVGDYATVGAGSVVIRAVEPHSTVFGNPAKTIFRKTLQS
ncbi:MAG: acetyltransferase [Opitutales bacterium]|nr:acetyltransferase [Opitutales bacterium]